VIALKIKNFVQEAALNNKIVILVINYNGRKALGDIFERSLNSIIESVELLRKRGFDVEPFFVDNNSYDESVSVARQKRFSLINLNRNLGYAGACYIAFNHVRVRGINPDLFVFLNNDIIMDSENFYKFIRFVLLLKKRFQGIIVTPLLLNGYTGELDHGGQFIDSTGATWSISLVMNRQIATMLRPTSVSYCDGAVLVADDVALERVGVFDPRFFMYYEDVELSLRAWSRGIPSILLPIIVGVHYRSATAKIRPEMLYFNVRNRVYTTRKYFGYMGVFMVILYYLFYVFRFLDLDSVANTRFYLKSNDTIDIYRGFKYITRAIIDGARMKQYKDGKASRCLAPVLNLSISDLFSMKKLYIRIIESIYNYISLKRLKARENFHRG
jgi:GT2 family glycosyltransferase